MLSPALSVTAADRTKERYQAYTLGHSYCVRVDFVSNSGVSFSK